MHYILNARQRNILLKSGITVFLIRELYNNCSETKTVSNESSVSVSKHVIIFCMCAFFINEKKKRKGSFEKSYQFSCPRYYSWLTKTKLVRPGVNYNWRYKAYQLFNMCEFFIKKEWRRSLKEAINWVIQAIYTLLSEPKYTCDVRNL